MDEAGASDRIAPMINVKMGRPVILPVLKTRPNNLLTGTEPPDDSVEAYPGDKYFDTVSGKLYRRKS